MEKVPNKIYSPFINNIIIGQETGERYNVVLKVLTEEKTNRGNYRGIEGRGLSVVDYYKNMDPDKMY